MTDRGFPVPWSLTADQLLLDHHISSLTSVPPHSCNPIQGPSPDPPDQNMIRHIKNANTVEETSRTSTVPPACGTSLAN